MSFAVDKLDAATADLVGNGAIDSSTKPRDGLQGWQVIDLARDAAFGALLQLTQDR